MFQICKNLLRKERPSINTIRHRHAIIMRNFFYRAVLICFEISARSLSHPQYDRTPLHFAAFNGHTNAVRWLISQVCRMSISLAIVGENARTQSLSTIRACAESPHHTVRKQLEGKTIVSHISECARAEGGRERGRHGQRLHATLRRLRK